MSSSRTQHSDAGKARTRGPSVSSQALYQRVNIRYSKTCVKLSTLKDHKLVFKTDYCLMQVISIAEGSNGEHSAILSTFIKLPFVIKIFVLSIFEWPFYTGFTVQKSRVLALRWIDLVLLGPDL